jgi:small-conductance mechanosensitive channel
MRFEPAHLAVPITVAVVSCIVLLFVRRLVLKLLVQWADRKENRLRIYQAVWPSVSAPSVYWCIAVGLYVGTSVSTLSYGYMFWVDKIIYVILVLSASIVAANIAGKIFRSQVQRLDIPISTAGIVSGVFSGTIVIIGLLIILSILGISIAPLITALGVGGLAVALALQDTLANLFAGLQILVEKSIRVGDFVRIETGQEGYVDDITWRTTRIRTLSSTMVMVPNKKLAQSVVVNYSLPGMQVGVGLLIRVAYPADFEKIEAVLLEEAGKAISELPGLVQDQQPSVSFAPGENTLDFTLGFTVKTFVDQYGVQNEMRKRIFRRLKEEGFEPPFPTRTI